MNCSDSTAWKLLEPGTDVEELARKHREDYVERLEHAIEAGGTSTASIRALERERDHIVGMRA